MDILIVGSGGREHALALTLKADPGVDALHVIPGNAGTSLIATNHAGDPMDCAAVVALALRLGVDLVVIGPEAPLVAGLADAVREVGIDCFGPSKAAAALEGSKAFAKRVMAEAGVPTAMAHVCSELSQVVTAMSQFGPPYVIKEDGLAAGKGVVVTADSESALAHARACLARPGGIVVVEEYLDGPEVSLFAVTDGTTAIPLLPAQDFKRVGDGDAGPNTGGMGAYSPLPWAPPDLVAEVMSRVIRPTLATMTDRGTPFSGLLYAGLAVTTRGVRVVEFNVRFGDPETQAVLAMLRTPLGALLRAAARGKLAEFPDLLWHPGAALTVVLAAPGYPQSAQLGGIIKNAPEATGDCWVVHSGTAISEGQLVATGGRVLCVTARGDDLAQARARAYSAISQVELAGSHYRSDIALAAVSGQVKVPGSRG